MAFYAFWNVAQVELLSLMHWCIEFKTTAKPEHSVSLRILACLEVSTIPNTALFKTSPRLDGLAAKTALTAASHQSMFGRCRLLVLFGDWELKAATTEVAGGLTMPPALPYPVRAGGWSFCLTDQIVPFLAMISPKGEADFQFLHHSMYAVCLL